MSVDTKFFMNLLCESVGIKEFVGVADSTLKYPINWAEDNNLYVEAPNEGEAVSYAVGSYLGGKKVAVMMQNSGFMNALSPITSLACIYHVPLLYIVGYRGMHGKGTDEPQHEFTGEITEKWFKDLRINVYYFNSFDGSLSDIVYHINSNIAKEESTVILVDKNDFDSYEPQNDNDEAPLFSMPSRTEILSVIDSRRDDKTVVITSTGFVSRDMYDKFNNPKNFYMVGSMGCALTIGLGLAKSRPDLKVIVVEGDGSIVMRPQGMIMSQIDKLSNLAHVVIDNREYESTGGQKVPSIDLHSMMCGMYDISPNCTTVFNDLSILKHYVEDFVKNGTSKHPFIIMRSDTSNNNNKLGRPKESSVELRDIFLEGING